MEGGTPGISRLDGVLQRIQMPHLLEADDLGIHPPQLAANPGDLLRVLLLAERPVVRIGHLPRQGEVEHVERPYLEARHGCLLNSNLGARAAPRPPGDDLRSVRVYGFSRGDAWDGQGPPG